MITNLAVGRLRTALILPISIFLLLSAAAVSRAASPTTTTLVVSPAQPAVAEVVTLTATVSTSPNTTLIGFVDFFDQNVLLGSTSVLTKAGGNTATFKTIGLGPGPHSLIAKFRGTPNGAVAALASTSATVPVTVSAQLTASTQLHVRTDLLNPYTVDVSATVSSALSFGGTGSVTFTDSTTGQPLGTSPLLPSSSSYSLSTSPNVNIPSDYNRYTYVAAGDLNNDGALDFVLVNIASQTMTAYLADPLNPTTFTAQATLSIPSVYSGNLTLADLNGDGYLDVVLSSSTLNYTYFAIPAQPGNFVVGDTIDTQFHTYSVVVSDLNSDGILDLVVGSAESGLFVYRGDPNNRGHFLAPAHILTPGGTSNGLRIADFNNDGLPDIFGFTFLLLNNPQTPGQFLPPIPIALSLPATVTAIGDLTGDGVPDYVTLANAREIGICPGDAANPGIISNCVIYTAPIGVTYFTAVLQDLDNDGYLDVISAPRVLFNDKNHPGTLLPAIIPPCSDPNGCNIYPAAGDFNGDGVPDSVGVGTDHVLLSLGQFTYTSTASLQQVTLGQTGTNVLGATYSGDSYTAGGASAPQNATQPLQTAVTLAAINSQGYVAGQGAIHLQATVKQAANLVPVGAVDFKDGQFVLGTAGVANGVAVLSTATLGPGVHSLTAVYRGAVHAAQPFGPSTSSPQSFNVGPYPPTTLVTAYKKDLFALPTQYQVDVLGLGAGFPLGTVDAITTDNLIVGSAPSLDSATHPAFAAAATQVRDQSLSHLLVDVNGDGLLDFIAAAGNTTIEVSLGASIPPGSFADAQGYGTDLASKIVAGDFNGDGLPDIAALSLSNPSVTLYLNDPLHPGSFLSGGTFPFESSNSYSPYGILATDLNGDGLLDLVTTDIQSITVLLNDPAHPGSFVPQSPFQFDWPIGNVQLGDLNQDGVPDILFSEGGLAPDTQVLYADTQNPGHFLPPQVFSVEPTPILLADFNGDGFPDLAYYRCCSDNSLYIRLSDVTHPGQFGPEIVSDPSTPLWSPTLVVYDINHDGHADLISTEADNTGPNLYNLVVKQFLSDSANPGHFFALAPLSIATNFVPVTLFPADLNGDGVLDFLFAGNGLTAFLQGHVSEVTASLVIDFAPQAVPVTFRYSGDSVYPPNTSTTFLVGSDCFFLNLGNSHMFFSADAAQSSFQIVGNLAGCAWTGLSDQPWLTLTNPNGFGGGTASFTLAPNNTGAPRTAVVKIGGQNLLSVTQDSTATTFADLEPSATYFDAASLMFAAGVTTGCIQGPTPETRSFCPDQNVTREQMAAFIVRAVTGTTTPASYNPVPFFTDVPPSNPFFPHIQKLMELGITTGCGAGLFCPNNTVSRWQMAIFMIRARLSLYGATFPTATVPYFADVPANVEGNGQPFPFIQRSYEEHITNGCGTNPLVYCPDQLVTRGQMASFIMRGLFNETVPIGPTEPMLTGVSPNTTSSTPGAQVTVTITGINTNFQAGDTVTVPSGMFAVSNVLVNSATSISATLTANANVVAGPQSVVVTSGGLNLSFPLALKVGSY